VDVLWALIERRYRVIASHGLCSTNPVHKKILPLLLLVVVSLDVTGCAMSAQARRERAYRHYVQKEIKQRRREMARAQKAANRQLKLKMRSAVPSEPQVTSSVETASNSWSEPVAAPVTVSASDSITNQAPDQPSQP
jgi:hypothetical protein